MKLVVGLGNPGREYARTRHNVGFQCLDLLAERHGIRLTRRGKSSMGEGRIEGAPVALVKPLTFMNSSGEVVGPMAGRLRVPLADVLVVYDDLDLPVGKLRLRASGSAGGHNGMKSIIASLGSSDFARLRIGIGRPEGSGGGAIDYVLGTFRKEEKSLVQEALDRAADAVEVWVAQGIEEAMNQFNG